MPYGLKGASAIFERLMETVLAGLQWGICLIYLDDVIVLGRSFEDMATNLKKVYDRLLAAGLKLKAKKCHLFCKGEQKSVPINIIFQSHVPLRIYLHF